MSDDDLDLIQGSGNVFRDLDYPDAEVCHVKALLAAEIIKVLGVRRHSTRQAEASASIAYAELSRARNVKLDRFQGELTATHLAAA